MGKKNRGIRAQWTEETMAEALQFLREGNSQESVARRCGIPRRTLRNHFTSGSSKRSLGAKPLLNKQQENDLEVKIIRFAEKGFPLTSKSLRRSVFKFCETVGVPHKFNKVTQLAGKEWYRSFLKRHPKIAQRRAQQLNPARAQKLNRYIVDDYFTKLGNLLTRTGLKNRPEKLYNMDEKGCRLTLHHQQRVLAEKGTRKVHLVAPEHAENATIVACANALGQVVPPMILFKGQRQKPTYSDGLPAGSVVCMTPKGSMTTGTFLTWLDHFANFMSAPPTILIFDGASSHLDLSIADKAESLGIELFCLPSNTTHQLQPMDVSVFRPFESQWDQELLNYWDQHPSRTLNKERFSDVFKPVWEKSLTMSNICSGFRATGIYPFNKNAVPEHAFAPSLPSNRLEGDHSMNNEIDNRSTEQGREIRVGHTEWDPEDNIPLSNFVKKTTQENSFSGVLITPDIKSKTASTRKKSFNYRAQEVKRQVFEEHNSQKKGEKNASKPSTSCAESQESWMCTVCNHDHFSDMRACASCGTWVHEECVGLTVEDTEDFICPECMP